MCTSAGNVDKHKDLYGSSILALSPTESVFKANGELSVVFVIPEAFEIQSLEFADAPDSPLAYYKETCSNIWEISRIGCVTHMKLTVDLAEVYNAETNYFGFSVEEFGSRQKLISEVNVVIHQNITFR